MNRDHEDLKTLAIFYYVSAGLSALLAVFPLIYLVIGVLMMLFMGAAAADVGGSSGSSNEAPPEFVAAMLAIPGLFIVFSLLGIVGCFIGAYLQYLTGRMLVQHRGYVFCMVSACFHLMSFPLGTILGVFTLLVLTRESTKALFHQGVRYLAPARIGPTPTAAIKFVPTPMAAPRSTARPLLIGGVIAGFLAMLIIGLFIGYCYVQWSISRSFARRNASMRELDMHEDDLDRDFDDRGSEDFSHSELPGMNGQPPTFNEALPPDAPRNDTELERHSEALTGAGLPFFADSVSSDPQTVDEAIIAIQSSDSHKRKIGAEWLSKASRDEGQQAKVARALDRLILDDDPLAGEAALAAAAVWGDSESTPALLAALARPFRGELAIAALAQHKDPRAVDALVKMINEPFANGEAAADALAGFPPETIREPLIARMHDGEDRARERARRILLAIGAGDELYVQTRRDLDSTEQRRRRAAFEWLATCEVKDAHRSDMVKAIARAIEPGPNWLNDPSAAALSRWATKEHVSLLQEMMEETDDGRRSAGLRALLEVDPEAAAAPLAKIVVDRQQFGRAMLILRQSGPNAEAAVLPLLDHKDSAVQTQACLLLMQMGSQQSKDRLAKVVQAAKARGDLKLMVMSEGALRSIENRERFPSEMNRLKAGARL